MPYKDPNLARAANRASYKKYNPARKAKHAEWRQANPEYSKDYLLYSRYGITAEARDAMRRGQGNRCLVCAEEFSDTDKALRPVVDHCHKTQRVRGLLHAVCNSGLGMFKDRPEVLRKAAAYLEASWR